LLELKTSGMSLEDIFLKLTTKDLTEESEVRSQESGAGNQQPDIKIP
jgi:hypothetical protein